MSKKLSANREITAAAREAGAAETRRCAEVTRVCLAAGVPERMLEMIISGKSPDEVEKVLKASATTASWDKAINTTGGSNG